MAKKQQLKLSHDFDFVLIGILCQHKEYRLCNAINKLLGIGLTRSDDLELQNIKSSENASFSLYEFADEDGRQYYIIANKDSHNRCLIPEQSKMDYFVLLKGSFIKEETENIRLQLKSIPLILGAYKIDIKKLKTKENLLF